MNTDKLIPQSGPTPIDEISESSPIHLTNEASNPEVSNVRSLRKIIVEPVMLLFCLVLEGNNPLLEQYIYSRFKQDYPILLNITHPLTDTGCNDINKTNPVFIATQAVQSETSQLQIFMAVSNQFPLITAILYGAYSDMAGRKPVLLLPCIAVTMKISINALIVYFDLPVYCILIGQVLNGLGGGYFTFTVAIYAYLADTTDPEGRGLRMVLADTIKAFAIAASNLGVGYAIDNIGFLYTHITLICLITVAIVLIVFTVPETRIKDKEKLKKFSLISLVKSIYVVFSKKEGSRHIKIFLVILAFLLCNIPLKSLGAIQLRFVMNIPLCWGPVLIGIYFGVGALAYQIGSVVGLKLFQMCRIPEIWIAAIGVGSVIASALVNAWANSLFLMIMVAVANVFFNLPSPLFRTMASRLVKENEQVTVLAGFGCVGCFCYLASSVVMNTIYRETLFFMPGFVFIVEAIFGGLTILVIISFVVFTKKTTEPM